VSQYDNGCSTSSQTARWLLLRLCWTRWSCFDIFQTQFHQLFCQQLAHQSSLLQCQIFRNYHRWQYPQTIITAFLANESSLVWCDKCYVSVCQTKPGNALRLLGDSFIIDSVLSCIPDAGALGDVSNPSVRDDLTFFVEFVQLLFDSSSVRLPIDFSTWR